MKFLDRRTNMVTDKQIAKQLNFSRIFLFFTTLTSAKYYVCGGNIIGLYGNKNFIGIEDFCL